jgi:uncharacterized membrane protein
MTGWVFVATTSTGRTGQFGNVFTMWLLAIVVVLALVMVALAFANRNR